MLYLASLMRYTSTMSAGALVRETRKRSGISQTELAKRLRTTQSAVARLESGDTNPRFETVLSAVRACGFDLHYSVAAFDRDHRRLIDESLALTPSRRLDALVDRLAAEASLRRAQKLR